MSWVDIGLLLVVTVGLSFAGAQLNTIWKSAELTTSQIVMDTYYRARNLVVESAQSLNVWTLEAVKYKFEIDQRAAGDSKDPNPALESPRIKKALPV